MADEGAIRVISSAASEGAKLHAAPAEFEFRGGRYKLAPLDLGVEAEFEDWLVTQALAKCRRYARDVVNPAEAENRILRDAGTGGYSRGSEAWVVGMDNDRGQVHLLWLRLRRSHPGATEELAREILAADREDAVKRAMNAMDDVPEESGDSAPNAEVPAGDRSPAGNSTSGSTTPTPPSSPAESNA